MMTMPNNIRFLFFEIKSFICQRLMSRQKKLLLIPLPEGQYLMGQADHVGKKLYTYPLYENALCRVFDFFSEHCSNFIDVGANIGFHAIQRALKYKHVFAFEPNPAIAGILRQNCYLNGLKNIEIYECGLSNETASLEFLLTASILESLHFSQKRNLTKA